MLITIKKFYNYYLSKDKAFAKQMRDLTGFVPANVSLYKQVFFHKSRTDHNEYSSGQSNERLEFLGDAILSTVIAEYLFKKYPDSDEGFLTKMRAKIVRRKTLNALGDSIGLDTYLYMYNSVNISDSMVGNALEALIGAIYLENGFRNTKHFIINNLLMQHIDLNRLENYNDNYKSLLLEWCQKNGKSVSYNLIKKDKRNNRDYFSIVACIGKTKVSEGEAYSKKGAEQKASEQALQILNISKVQNMKEPPII